MIELINVHKTYQSNGVEALKGVSFRIEDGDFVFLIGPSGSGKSSIVNLITREEVATEGTLKVNGYSMRNITKKQILLMRRSLGIIFQNFRLIEKKTVEENLAFVMRAVGASPKEIEQRIPYILDLVGLSHKRKSYPYELSGGEQQRVAIARALMNDPKMIVADEPTGNLDPALSDEIMCLLEKINEMGTTVMVVTHDRGLVDKFSKRVIKIEGGLVASDMVGGYSKTTPTEAETVEKVEPLEVDEVVVNIEEVEVEVSTGEEGLEVETENLGVDLDETVTEEVEINQIDEDNDDEKV